MKLVVDTNALCYLMLQTEPFHASLLELFSGDHVFHAPASWEAEYANVLWLASRAGVIGRTAIPSKLTTALGLGIESVSVQALWSTAIELSSAEDQPVYDTLFVALARRLEAPLVTYDRAVLQKFPDVAKTAEMLLEHTT